MEDKFTALLKFLSATTTKLEVAEQVFVVGGAVRNFLLGASIKDLDLVIDTTETEFGQDSAWLARELEKCIPARTSLVTNNYGVAILSVVGSWVLGSHEMKGEVLEIANARSESYGGEEGKGYKPHLTTPASIAVDLARRDFSLNTLMWRLADLKDGAVNAPVLDILGIGLKDLGARELRTPQDPDRTFSDDPTRMLRAIRFSVKYKLRISEATIASIQRNAAKLVEMPWDAVRKILVDLLQDPDHGEVFRLLNNLELNGVVIILMKTIEGFQRGVSRPFASMDIRVALDAITSGWPLSPSPVAFFNSNQIELLAMALRRAWDPDKLWAAIKRPPIDQSKLFEKHKLEGAARQHVVAKARELLLECPALSMNPERLEAEVSAALSAMH